MNTIKKTVLEIALEYRVHESTVRRWIKLGYMPFEKIGRTIRITGPAKQPRTGDVSVS